MQAIRRQLSVTEIIIRGLKKVADERIDGIESHSNTDNNEELMHDARTAIKQFRALWRLLKPAVFDEIYNRNNIALRDAGRELSTVRDIAVARNIIEEMLIEASSVKARSMFEAVIEGLAKQESFHPILDKSAELIKAIGVLKESRSNFSKLKLFKEGWSGPALGIKETYGRARKEMKKANRSYDDIFLHNWRKAAKYLWYQLQFVELIRPNGLGKIVVKLKKLGQRLGDYHDNVMLIERLNADPVLFGGIAVTDSVIELLYKRKRKLKRASFKIGNKIYLHKPKAFLTKVLPLSTIFES